MPWSTSFDEPIPLRGGGRLATLQHAADYIMKLPEDVQQQERWQVAVILTTPDEVESWMMAPPDEALTLQRPLLDGALKIVARVVKEDPVATTP